MDSEDNATRLKICLLGPCKSGKTSLIHTLSNNGTYTAINDVAYKLEFSDTDSNAEYTRISSDIFLLCLDISNGNYIENNFNEIRKYREIARRRPNILVGCKSDLRIIGQSNIVSIEECKKLCNEIDAEMYVELSSMHSEKYEIDKMLRQIVLCHIRHTHWEGYKLPKVEQKYAQRDAVMNILDLDRDQKLHKLLIAGYVNETNSSLIIPSEIVILIYSYFYHPKIVYYTNPTSCSGKRLEHFGQAPEIKRNFYIMFWMDLIAIIIHNIVYLYFSIQLLSVNTRLGAISLVFSILESIIIIIAYYLLFCWSKMEYYTDGVCCLHGCMECIVNLPMIIIQIIYLLSTDSTALIPTFYLSISIYITYGLYKIGINLLCWNGKNALDKEPAFPMCVVSQSSTWCCAMISLWIIGSVYIANDMNKTIAIVIVVTSICACCVVMCARHCVAVKYDLD